MLLDADENILYEVSQNEEVLSTHIVKVITW